YLYRYLFSAGGAWQVRAPATLGCAATLLYVRMSEVLVGMERLRGWQIVYRTLYVLLSVIIGWTALGDYRVTAPLANAAGAL
ncbi:hypothetical protein ABTF68_22240, partial [Acinetobacter baumannii]